MPPVVSFFNPADLLSLATWEVQSDTVATPAERLQGLDATGDEAASALVNKRINTTLVLKCFETSGNLALPVPGTVTSTGHHVDSIALRLSPNDWPTLTVVLHKHDNGATHAEGSCRTYTPTLTIAAGRGIPRAGTGFTLGAADTAVGLASFDYSVSVTHQDEVGDTGNWLAGENRDGMETVQIGLTGKGASITAPAGWDKVDGGDARGNTAAETETASYEHHVAADA